MPEFPSLAHIAVTVTDLDRSTTWYTALFGSEPVLDEDEESGTFHHTVYALSDGHLFGLHTHTVATDATFDERTTGLDHVAFACSGRGELQQWAERLTELGISHQGIKDAAYGSGVSFRDPDGIALEFFAPPGVD
jgi:catechol-2,3-dioxygenase